MEVKATVDEAVGIAKEVHGFWGKLAKMFGGAPAPAPAAPKPVAKKKEKYVAVDETQVMANVVSQLTEFFRLQEQLAAHIREEEEKSQTVYDPNANLMEAALKRVMAQDQMAALEVTIRETMVYQSPPEMGALYSKVFEMRDVIASEQEAARLKQEAKNRREAWQHREEEGNLQAKLAAVVAASIFLLYLWMWLWFVSQWGKK
jgi:hypothetical protein